MADQIHRKVQVWIWRDHFVLLLRTNEERGGFWQPVTGNLKENESLEEAALREAREETGLKFEDEKLVPLDYEFEFEGRHGRTREVVYTLKSSSSDVIIDPLEHQEFRWLDIHKPEEVFKLLAFPSNRDAFERVLKINRNERVRER